MCLDTFNFQFSGILILLLWSDIHVFRTCVDPMYTALHFYIQFCRLSSLSCSLRLYYEFCFRVFYGIEFFFYNCITYSISFIIAFGRCLCCVFPECRRGENSFKIFMVFSSSLILSLF